MSLWDNHQMENRIRTILDVQSHNPEHHFERPFLTPYQIAIEFRRLYRADFDRIGKPLGGKGTGQHDSLAQYIALELSKRLRNRELPGIEGRFLHRAHLSSLTYRVDGETIESSSQQAYDLSMFRLGRSDDS